MSFSYNRLIQSLKKLPSIGKRSATRIAFHLLEIDRREVRDLVEAIDDFVKKTRHCKVCGLISEQNPCRICSGSGRDQQAICVVKNVQDAISIERSHGYRGLYHVLGGLISPLEGINEEDLPLEGLLCRLRRPRMEVIFALEQTPEAEATISLMKKKILSCVTGIKLSRMAMGIPIGTELEYLDGLTLKSSLDNRHVID